VGILGILVAERGAQRRYHRGGSGRSFSAQ
jgi:hypothetical protein